MSTDYAARLAVKLEGDPWTRFRDKHGELLAVGYERVVIGERGPYVEFTQDSLVLREFEAVEAKHRYYLELRSRHSNVKCYVQSLPVDYADYRPGLCYISPFDVYVDGKPVIVPL